MASKEPSRAIALGDTAIGIVVEDEVVEIEKGFKLTVNGVTVSGQPAFARWASVARTMRIAEKAAPFAIGDILNYGEARYGEEAAQIIDAASGWSLSTIGVYCWLSKRIALAIRRMDRLTIRHHLAVAALTPAKQKLWLQRAANDDGDEPWTVKQLAEALRDGEEELPDAALWLLVRCTTATDQTALQASLEAQGRTVKALERRTRKKKSPES